MVRLFSSGFGIFQASACSKARRARDSNAKGRCELLLSLLELKCYMAGPCLYWALPISALPTHIPASLKIQQLRIKMSSGRSQNLQSCNSVAFARNHHARGESAS